MSEHLCHRPGCGKPVPPAMLACSRDWFALPRGLRARIWREYRPGQEIDKNPTRAYLEVMRECIAFWTDAA